MNALPDWLVSTLASDATGGRGVLPDWIGSLTIEARAVGPAFVAFTSQDDNLVMREIIQVRPASGSVLLIAGGASSRTATIGGLLSLEMRNLGIRGLVTDGLVRDSRELRQISDFSVWCRGVTPSASQKQGPMQIGGVISIGGVLIRNGDLVIADEDGIVVWPQEQVEGLLIKAEAQLKQDNARLAQLRQQL